MSKARITYRLDDSRQNMNKQPSVERSERKVVPLHAEETAKIGQEDGEKAEKKRAVNDRRPILNQFTSDFGSWSSPFDEETLRLEQMIRQSGGIGQPTASASSRRDEAPSIYPNAGGGSFRADGEFVTRRHEPEVLDDD